MPPEMVEEDETYLSLDKKAFYEKLKEAAQMAERMGVIENRIGKIEAQIHGLSMTVSSTMEGEHIEIDQQEQFRTIIGILGRRYEEKHGKGTFYNVEASLKKQYNFTFYRTITRQQWGQLIRECVQMFHSLFPKGTRLPDVLEHALNSINQDRLF